jgi:hypothetical protein
MSVNQMSVNQMSVNKMSVNKMSVNKIDVNQMSVEQMFVDKMSVDQMSADQMSADQMSFYQTTWMPHERLTDCLLKFLHLMMSSVVDSLLKPLAICRQMLQNLFFHSSFPLWQNKLRLYF